MKRVDMFTPRQPLGVGIKKIENKPEVNETKKGNVFKALFWFQLILIIAGLSATGFYFYNKRGETPVVEIKDTVAEVSKLFFVPQDETPSLATVTDKETLKDQDFFSKAENGDKILIYEKSKIIILYRPSVKKIVSVSMLSLPGDENKPIEEQKQPVVQEVVPVVEQSESEAQRPVQEEKSPVLKTEQPIEASNNSQEVGIE